MANPALDYAENVLGVHKVFEEANVLNSDLNEALDGLDKAQDERRNLDDKIEDRLMEILIDERGKHPDHSQAAMDRHLKEVHHKDQALAMLRSQRNAKAGECAGFELDIKYIESQLRVMVARMNTLGGYFQFLAACKMGEIEEARKTTQPTSPTQPHDQEKK